MQFLASLHIVLTCSFVVLLAYVLSRLFTYLAHSVINGSDKARTMTEGSSRSRRSESFQRQFEKEHTAAMAELHEEDENEDEEDAYQDAELRAASLTLKYEIGGGIFDDGIDQEYDLKRDDGKQASWDNDGIDQEKDVKRDDGKQAYKEGMKEEGLDAADNGRYEGGGGDTTQLEEGEKLRKENAGKNGLLSSDDDFKEEEEEKGTSSESELGDTQGSSSLQQRLPPTWSDLERMVNLSSKKHSPPPSVSPLPED